MTYMSHGDFIGYFACRDIGWYVLGLPFMLFGGYRVGLACGSGDGDISWVAKMLIGVGFVGYVCLQVAAIACIRSIRVVWLILGACRGAVSCRRPG